MASEDGRTIAGDGGLLAATEDELGDDTWIEVDTDDRNSRKVDRVLLRTLLGALAATGDVSSAGNVGGVTLSIVNGRVTLAKLQNIGAGKILGSVSGGAPQELTIGSGLHIAGTSIVADAVAAVLPALSVLVYRATPGGL